MIVPSKNSVLFDSFFKYVIVPVPDEIAPSMSGAYYLAPPADGSRPGTFYINTYNPSGRKRYSATSTGLHEAEPGHHLQGKMFHHGIHTFIYPCTVFLGPGWVVDFYLMPTFLTGGT